MTSPDVSRRLDEIQARADAATPPPWKTWAMDVLADPVGNSDLNDAVPVAHTVHKINEKPRTFNADFIASARQDVPDLTAAIRAVLELCEKGAALPPRTGFDQGIAFTSREIVRVITEKLGEK